MWLFCLVSPTPTGLHFKTLQKSLSWLKDFKALLPQVRASLVAQMVKNLPAMWETSVQSLGSLGQEDPPEKEMATHSSILAWKIPWTEEFDGLQPFCISFSWGWF